MRERFTYESPDGKVRPVPTIGYAFHLASQCVENAADNKGIIRNETAPGFEYVIKKGTTVREVEEYFDNNYGRL